MNIQLLGLGRSKSAASLAKLVPMERLNKRLKNGEYSRKIKPDPEGVIVNYGVQGRHLESFYTRWPMATRIRTINRYMPYNKYSAVCEVSGLGVPCPDVDARFWESEFKQGWIYKPYLSGAGYGIERITEENFQSLNWSRGYAQQEITDRPYEIRITGFRWLPKEEWGVWKKRKEGEHRDELTWNHEQGGIFVTVKTPLKFRVFKEAMEHTDTILRHFALGFGAVDFILDSEKRLYFLELNTRPGFTRGYSDGPYISAFRALKEISEHRPDIVDALCQPE